MDNAIMDPAIAKKVLRLFTYGMYVVTSKAGNDLGAFTADWVFQVSFEPRMLAISVENDAFSLRVMRKSKVFAVNVLESGQRELAGQFGRSTAKVGNKLEGYSYTDGSTGSPLLAEALGAVECRIVSEQTAGDHILFVAEVVDAHLNREGEPLTMKETGFRYFG
jgi:flavin reductase (DIM6/NTAB) family NADH-FMN oxidoreductase RutF